MDWDCKGSTKWTRNCVAILTTGFLQSEPTYDPRVVHDALLQHISYLKDEYMRQSQDNLGAEIRRLTRNKRSRSTSRQKQVNLIVAKLSLADSLMN
jgi:hypothetical protein